MLGRFVAHYSAWGVYFGDAYEAKAHLDTLRFDQKVISGCIVTNEGKRLVEFSKAVFQSLEEAGAPITDVECLADQQFVTRFEGGYLDIIQPILWEETKQIGQLHMRVSLAGLNKRVVAFTMVIVLIVLLVTMFAIVLSARLQHLISQPILSLAQTANTINRFKDYSLRARTDRQDEIGQLMQAFNSMLDTIELQNRTLMHMNEHLEDEVAKRTSELMTTNSELEAFTYSVSHDLRSPLRSVDGFSAALLEDCKSKLDTHELDYVVRIRAASQRMGNLIDSLLHLSRVSRQEMEKRTVNLSVLAEEIAQLLRENHPQHPVQFNCQPNLNGLCDRGLIKIVLENLLSNAWKYTGKVAAPEVSFSGHWQGNVMVYCVGDNGAGFDMKYMDKLFGPFQRLHSDSEFEGIGIGLATVARIIHRHGGNIWVDAAIDQGARFYFTLDSVATYDG